MNQIVKFATVCAGYGGTRLNSRALEQDSSGAWGQPGLHETLSQKLKNKNKQKLKEEKENLT